MRALSASGKNVINVSTYPCVEDLLAITDVLISDYSSIFFDFGLLGRTAFIYAPDLHHYREVERGFYGIWPEDSGMPLITSPDELVRLVSVISKGPESPNETEQFQLEVEANLDKITGLILRHI